MEIKIRSTVANAIAQFELDWATISGIWWRHNRDINVTFHYPYKKISQCVIALETLQACDKFFQKESIKSEKGIGGLLLDTDTGTMEIEIF